MVSARISAATAGEPASWAIAAAAAATTVAESWVAEVEPLAIEVATACKVDAGHTGAPVLLHQTYHQALRRSHRTHRNTPRHRILQQGDPSLSMGLGLWLQRMGSAQFQGRADREHQCIWPTVSRT